MHPLPATIMPVLGLGALIGAAGRKAHRFASAGYRGIVKCSVAQHLTPRCFVCKAAAAVQRLGYKPPVFYAQPPKSRRLLFCTGGGGQHAGQTPVRDSDINMQGSSDRATRKTIVPALDSHGPALRRVIDHRALQQHTQKPQSAGIGYSAPPVKQNVWPSH